MRRRGLFGGAFDVIFGLILLGIFIAVLRQFNWDIGALVIWVYNMCKNFVMSVADFFAGSPTFSSLF